MPVTPRYCVQERLTSNCAPISLHGDLPKDTPERSVNRLRGLVGERKVACSEVNKWPAAEIQVRQEWLGTGAPLAAVQGI
jgi:hypothetical protein